MVDAAVDPLAEFCTAHLWTPGARHAVTHPPGPEGAPGRRRRTLRREAG
ncbi:MULTISPECIES: hypothetical protein [Pseudonocardia]|nr:hypothetical protein [Pseudonocardia sp. SID8383]MYW72056.1 hypothetical protein [Pseudonocardia sp. SID8383]